MISHRALNIRLYNKDTKKHYNTTVCKIESSLLTRFQEKAKADGIDINSYLSKWVRIDFNIEMGFETAYSLELLRILVIDHYKAVQPVIYHTHLIDDKGWLQIWVSGNMEKEML